MKNIVKLFGAVFKAIYTHIVVPMFKQCRAISRTDTPEQERATFDTLMEWTIILVIIVIIIALMGWSYVFTVL